MSPESAVPNEADTASGEPRSAAVPKEAPSRPPGEPRSAAVPKEAPSRPPRVRVSSRVLLNTGEGKGKSSAAWGVMTRAWARGWRVGVVQFIKGGKWQVGERKLAEQLGIAWHTLGDGFTWESKDLDETAAKGVHAWSKAKEMLQSGEFDLVILDEITYAVAYGWVPESDVVAGISSRNPKTSVVMTGRNATKGLIDVADTVTEMKKVKHAYDQGVYAMKGIEY